MAKMIKQPHGGMIKIPDKGETANPNGRPRKYVCQLTEQGYKLSEVNDTIQAMVAMSLDELKSVFQNPKSTSLEVTIASAIKKSITKGNLDSLETLLNRVFGKPKENITSTVVTRQPLTEEEKADLDKQLDASV